MALSAVPGVENEIAGAYLLSDPGHRQVATVHRKGGVVVTVPKTCPDPIDTVVVLDLEGTPRLAAAH